MRSLSVRQEDLGAAVIAVDDALARQSHRASAVRTLSTRAQALRLTGVDHLLVPIEVAGKFPCLDQRVDPLSDDSLGHVQFVRQLMERDGALGTDHAQEILPSFVEGRLGKEDPVVRASHAVNLPRCQQMVQEVVLTVELEQIFADQLDEFKILCENNPGNCTLYFDVHAPEINGRERLRSRQFVIEPTAEFMRGARRIFGPDNISLKGN